MSRSNETDCFLGNRASNFIYPWLAMKKRAFQQQRQGERRDEGEIGRGSYQEFHVHQKRKANKMAYTSKPTETSSDSYFMRLHIFDMLFACH